MIKDSPTSSASHSRRRSLDMHAGAVSIGDDPPNPTPPVSLPITLPASGTHANLASVTKGRTQQKLAFLRKGRGGRSPTPTPEAEDEDEVDDEWLVEGTSSNGHVNAMVSVGREASALGRSLDTLASAEIEAMAPQNEHSDKRKSKGRSLAKKTSRLFGRGNRDKGHESFNDSHHHDTRHDSHHHDHHTYDSSGSSGHGNLPLAMPQAVRQSSFSSTASADTSNSSRHKHWSLSRGSMKGPSPPPSASGYRNVQESSGNAAPSSWHPPPSFALRRTPSGRETSPSDPSAGSTAAPISFHQQVRKRDSNQQLSASVPSLSRNGLPISSSVNNSSTSASTSGPQGNGRVSSWFSSLLSSDTSGSPSSVPDPNPAQQSSPLRKGPSAAASFLSAARQKAVGGVRYLLDSDAQPDKSEETMWVLGVGHPGYSPDDPFGGDLSYSPAGSVRGEKSPPSLATRFKESSGTYASSPPGRSPFGQFFSSSSSSGNLAAEPATPPDAGRFVHKGNEKPKDLKWPEQFYDDFRSRVWCTYRSQYAPIVPLPHGMLLVTPETYFGAFSPSHEGDSVSPPSTAQVPPRVSASPWSWVKGGSEDRGLTSDTGWGCMLRTGQSMLANALIFLHLGRGWRLPMQRPTLTPANPLEQAELESYAAYVRMLSWFLDDPSPLCPFSVHRMALIGKELGKEVGEWFGPSTAAGALKTLANAFPLCGLAVARAVDGVVYKSDVYSASNLSAAEWVPGASESNPKSRSRPGSVHRTSWGDQAVLILIDLRLGLDGVNPIYYDSIKSLFTFPQSVGIAGGRPSSSYYFVASQANSLFYLDPHFTRPAVPLRVPPISALNTKSTETSRSDHNSTHPTAPSIESTAADPTAHIDESHTHSTRRPPSVDVVDVDAHSPYPSPSRPTRPRRFAGSKSLRIVPTSSPLQRSNPSTPTTPTPVSSRPTSAVPSPSPVPGPFFHSTESSISSDKPVSTLPVDAQTAWFADAYSDPALRTFHCDRVKKLPLSGLDPSMLIGFLCTNEAEFDDFCERVANLPKKIFTIQDEPPVWSEDDGLESVSEPVSELDEDDFLSDDDTPDAAALPAMVKQRLKIEDDEDLPDGVASSSATVLDHHEQRDMLTSSSSRNLSHLADDSFDTDMSLLDTSYEDDTPNMSFDEDFSFTSPGRVETVTQLSMAAELSANQETSRPRLQSSSGVAEERLRSTRVGSSGVYHDDSPPVELKSELPPRASSLVAPSNLSDGTPSSSPAPSLRNEPITISVREAPAHDEQMVDNDPVERLVSPSEDSTIRSKLSSGKPPSLGATSEPYPSRHIRSDRLDDTRSVDEFGGVIVPERAARKY